MKNKNLNLFANRISKRQLLDQKTQLNVKGGNSEPPPIEGISSSEPPPIEGI